MLDRATHRSILWEEHCFLGRRSSPVLSIPLVLQLYSAGNILMQVFDTLVLVSLEMFGVSFV